jgi:molecular chaperone GrpE (heat shock protein)
VILTAEDDIASIAGQLAELTRTVEQMAMRLEGLAQRADNEQERATNQQERFDLAARELAQVSDRLQAAANALRHPV